MLTVTARGGHRPLFQSERGKFTFQTKTKRKLYHVAGFLRNEISNNGAGKSRLRHPIS
jgi:hypothetical protein